MLIVARKLINAIVVNGFQDMKMEHLKNINSRLTVSGLGFPVGVEP